MNMDVVCDEAVFEPAEERPVAAETKDVENKAAKNPESPKKAKSKSPSKSPQKPKTISPTKSGKSPPKKFKLGKCILKNFISREGTHFQPFLTDEYGQFKFYNQCLLAGKLWKWSLLFGALNFHRSFWCQSIYLVRLQLIPSNSNQYFQYFWTVKKEFCLTVPVFGLTLLSLYTVDEEKDIVHDESSRRGTYKIMVDSIIEGNNEPIQMETHEPVVVIEKEKDEKKVQKVTKVS